MTTPPNAPLDALLPCPHCGGTLLGRQEGERRTDGTAGQPALVICADCDARMLAYDLPAAVRKWNARALPADPSRAVLEAVGQSLDMIENEVRRLSVNPLDRPAIEQIDYCIGQARTALKSIQEARNGK